MFSVTRAEQGVSKFTVHFNLLFIIISGIVIVLLSWFNSSMGEDARCVGAPSKAILILVRNSTFITVYTPEQVINCKIFLFLSPNKKHLPGMVWLLPRYGESRSRISLWYLIQRECWWLRPPILNWKIVVLQTGTQWLHFLGNAGCVSSECLFC